MIDPAPALPAYKTKEVLLRLEELGIGIQPSTTRTQDQLSACLEAKDVRYPENTLRFQEMYLARRKPPYD